MAKKEDLASILNQSGIEAGSIDQASMIFRVTSIAVPTTKAAPDTSDYYNSKNILAVKGDLPDKIHFCYVVGDIPYGNVPDPNKHIVYEWHYNTLKEETLPNNPAMPKGFPQQVHGFAMLQIDEQPDPIIPGSPTLSGSFPEQNPHKGQFIGTEEGGMQISSTGGVEIISEGGSNTLSVGEQHVDIGKSKLVSTEGGNNNWLMVKNGFRDGTWLGFAMPNVLPLFPLCYDPFPNIPGIVEMYLRFEAYKLMVEGIMDLKDEFKELRSYF